MKSKPQHKKTHIKQHKLDPLEKQMLVQYLINQDTKKFPLRLSSLKDITNILLKSQNGQPINKH